MRRFLFVFTILTMSCFFGISSHANPDGPVITSPEMYEETKPNHSIVVRWNAPPTTGTISYYTIAIRRFAGDRENMDTTSYPVYVVDTTCPASQRSYTVHAPALAHHVNIFGILDNKYRISISAVLSDGRRLWSDHCIFYTGAHAGSLASTMSFKIYNGFTDLTKNQIYYAFRNWNDALNSQCELYNTYPFSQGTDINYYSDDNLYDGENIITKFDFSDVYDDPFDYEGILSFVLVNYSSYMYATEIDVYLNGNSAIEWSNSVQPGKQYVYNVFMHEVGHVFGLSDKYDSWTTEWTMHFFCDDGESKKTSLHNQDIKNLNQLN